MGTSNSNTDLSKRTELAQLRKVIDMKLSKYLLNKVDVDVKMYQSKRVFRFMNKDVTDTKMTYTVEVLDMKLKLAMTGIPPEVIINLSQNYRPTIQPFTR